MKELTVYGALGVLWSLVNFLFWSRIKRIEKDIEMNNQKTDEIEHNYLDRFEEMNRNINCVKEENTKEHNDIQRVITEKMNEIEKSIIRELKK